MQKRVKSKSPSEQLRDKERSRQFRARRRLFDEEELKQEMQEEAEPLKTSGRAKTRNESRI